MVVKTRLVNLLALGRATGAAKPGSKNARSMGGGTGYTVPAAPPFEFKPKMDLAGTAGEGTVLATFRLNAPSVEYALAYTSDTAIIMGPVIDGWQTLVVAEDRELEEGTFRVSIQAKTATETKLFEDLLVSIGQEPFNYAVTKSALKFNSDLQAGEEILNVQPVDSRLIVTAITLNTTHNDIFATDSGAVIKRGTGAITRDGEYDLDLTYTFAGDGAMPATTRTETITVEIEAVPLTGYEFNPVANLQGTQAAGTRVATFGVLNPGATYELVAPSSADLRIGTPLAGGVQTLVVAPGRTLAPGSHGVSIKVTAGPTTETFSNQSVTIAAIPFVYTVKPATATLDSDSPQGQLVAQFVPDDTRLTISGIQLGTVAEELEGIFAIDGSTLLRGEALINVADDYKLPLTFTFTGDGASPATTREVLFDVTITAVPITGFVFEATTGLEAPVEAGTVVGRFKADNPRATYRLGNNPNNSLALGTVVDGWQTLVVDDSRYLSQGTIAPSIVVTAGPTIQTFTGLSITVAAEPFDYSVTPVSATYNSELEEGGVIATLSAVDTRLTIAGVALLNDYEGLYGVEAPNKITREIVDHEAGPRIVSTIVTFSGDGASPATERSHNIATTHTVVPVSGFTFTPETLQAPMAAGVTVGAVNITNAYKTFEMISSTDSALVVTKTEGVDQWLIKVAPGKTLVAGDYTFTIRAKAGPATQEYTRTITVAEEAFDYTVNFSPIAFNSDAAGGTVLATLTAADPRLTVSAISLSNNYSNRFAVNTNRITRGTGALDTTTSYSLTVTVTFTGDNASTETTRQVTVPVTITAVPITGYNFTTTSNLRAPVAAGTVVGSFKVENAGAAYNLISSTGSNLALGSISAGRQTIVVAAGKTLAAGSYNASVRATAGPATQDFTTNTITVAAAYVTTVAALYDSFEVTVSASTLVNRFTPTDAGMTLTNLSVTAPTSAGFTVNGTDIQRGSNTLTPGNYELTISYRLTTPQATSIGPFTATFPFTGYDNSGGGGEPPL